MAASTPKSDRSGVVGIVLAAGAGRRMGGPKALIGPLAEAGRTPLARVCEWVHEAGCERVIAVIGAEADRVRDSLASDAWLVLASDGCSEWRLPETSSTQTTDHDEPTTQSSPWLTIVEASDWSDGMGASLRAGLRAASEMGAQAALITLVDLPDVRTPVYARMLDAARDHVGLTGALARASFDGRPGHPVLIGRDWWDAVAASAVGDRGARDLFNQTTHQRVRCGDLASGEDADHS